MRRVMSFIAVLLAVVPGACSSGGGGGGSDVNLRVNLTDAPMMGMKAVNVTITNVRIHQSADAAPGAAGWRDLPVTAAMPVDMMQISGGVLYELCSANLEAGHYQQVRLVVRQNAGAAPPYHNSVMTMDGAMHPLAMPGEMKVVHSFVVAPGTTTDLTCDLHVDQSMHQRGNGDYYMTPVLTANSTTK